MHDIKTTNNPYISLIDKHSPVTADHVCFWSAKYACWAKIKTTGITINITKDEETRHHILEVINPTQTDLFTRVAVLETRDEIVNSVIRSNRLNKLRGNTNG